MVAEYKPRIFLDTNVLFSGLYSSNGVPAIILEKFIKGDIEIVISQQVLEELVNTIKEKLPDALPTLKTLLVNMPPEVVADPEPGEFLPWKGKLSLGDASILTAAIKSEPDYFVTGDHHFLKVSGLIKKAGLIITTPAGLIKVIGIEK